MHLPWKAWSPWNPVLHPGHTVWSTSRFFIIVLVHPSSGFKDSNGNKQGPGYLHDTSEDLKYIHHFRYLQYFTLSSMAP